MIFIVGNSRSGTTMMGRILGNHSAICTLHEIHFFGELWNRNDMYRKISYEEALTVLCELISRYREGYLTKKRNKNSYKKEAVLILKKEKFNYLHDIHRIFLFYETRGKQKRIPCEQTPRNVFYIEEILELYPNAKIINMIRDPRDVLLSQKYKWKRRFLGAKNIPLTEAFRAWANYNPITISKLWNASVRGAFKLNDPRILHVKFEDLIQEPEITVKNICKFLAIDFQPQMLNVHRIGSSTEKDSPKKVGIDRNRKTNWKKGGLSKTEIYICQKICGKNMRKLQYREEEIEYSFLKLLSIYISFPLKLALAFTLNLRRMKSIKENVLKRLNA